MRINIHAGHNPDGKAACGAVGFIQESTEARKVKDEVISRLRQMGHTVYDCTCENGTDQADVLYKIVNACNAHSVDLDVSIHFNAGAGDKNGNRQTTGTEVLIYDKTSEAKAYAERVCGKIAELGFKNRGVKMNAGLYFLRKTKAPAMLVECCFVDDKDDACLYDSKKMAEAIVCGITGQSMEKPADCTGNNTTGSNAANKAKEPKGNMDVIYRVQVGAYAVKSNADAMLKKLKAAGFDAVVVKSS